ncbi:MAG: amidohydrolase family protein [Chloroflexi bacterium]|nr:amidohydrolase family protein [Chloroflexota bacterium]
MTNPPLVLAGGAVFDSEARLFRSGVDVVCRDGLIEQLAGDAPRPAGATVLDLTGHYLLPGLIDCHVHITSTGEPNDLSDARTDAPPVRAWKAAANARRTLHAGFTTVRDLGAAAHLNIHMAKAIDQGLIEGPTIFAAGMGVTMTGGHGHGFMAREADGPDDVRKAVREQLRAGATAIKLFASGGVLTPGVNPRSPSFTQEEMAAGVEEAHKAFRIVGAHAQATEGIKNAIRAGVDSIEHGVWLDEEAIGLMLERGTCLVATLTAPHVMVAGGADAGVAPYAIEKSKQVREDHIASFEAAVNAGVHIAMGTDQGTPLNRPGENAQELLRMAEHKLSPAAVILAATAWAADLLKAPAGRIQPGLGADFVVLPRDPLGDIEILARPGEFAAVIRSGRIVRSSPALAIAPAG